MSLPPGDFQERGHTFSQTVAQRPTPVKSLPGTDGFANTYLYYKSIRSGFSERRNLAVNDLVLVVTEKLPRGHWLLGQVLKVFPGPDGLVRTAEVKTKNSTILRPISKLCLLEESK